ncbi:hypothetical protein SLE2022_159290 [Rubroshorea leprosula]
MAEPPERVYCMDDCWVPSCCRSAEVKKKKKGHGWLLGSARNPASGFCEEPGCWVLRPSFWVLQNPAAGFRHPASGFCRSAEPSFCRSAEVKKKKKKEAGGRRTQLLGSATQLLGSADLQNPASADLQR